MDLCQIHLSEKSAFKNKTCFNLEVSFEIFKSLSFILKSFKDSEKLSEEWNQYLCIITNFDQLLSSYLLYFPLCLTKWMVETSRHFISNYFNMNHPRQGHFPNKPQYITLQKVSINSKSCCNMQNFLSCSKKCLLRICFTPLRIQSSLMNYPFNFSQSITILKFPVILHIWLIEEPRPFVL